MHGYYSLLTESVLSEGEPGADAVGVRTTALDDDDSEAYHRLETGQRSVWSTWNELFKERCVCARARACTVLQAGVWAVQHVETME